MLNSATAALSSSVSATYARSQASGSPNPSGSVEPAGRAEELSRRLESRLSEQLARIRQQIATTPAPRSTDGVGSVLDIRA